MGSRVKRGVKLLTAINELRYTQEWEGVTWESSIKYVQYHSNEYELSVASIQLHSVDSILYNCDNHNEYIKLSKCILVQKVFYALRKNQLTIHVKWSVSLLIIWWTHCIVILDTTRKWNLAFSTKIQASWLDLDRGDRRVISPLPGSSIVTDNKKHSPVAVNQQRVVVRDRE